MRNRPIDISFLGFFPRLALVRPTLSAEAPSHPRQAPPQIF